MAGLLTITNRASVTGTRKMYQPAHNLDALTPKETALYYSLVKMGDSPALAFDTVLNNRANEAKKEAATDFYRFAYTN